MPDSGSEGGSSRPGSGSGSHSGGSHASTPRSGSGSDHSGSGSDHSGSGSDHGGGGNQEPCKALPWAAPQLSNKRGVGVFDEGFSDAIVELGVSWVYNWGIDPSCFDEAKLKDKVEFVPVAPRAQDCATCPGFQQMKDAGGCKASALLGYNEPDNEGQSTCTVEEGLNAWPLLQQFDCRLGSPAVQNDGDGSWLEQFMDGAKERGYRVDFVAVHWYASEPSGWDDMDQLLEVFKEDLTNAHEKYGLPIWVTEFGLIGYCADPISFPPFEKQAQFMRESTAWMDGVEWIERYAPFALTSQFDVSISTHHLCDDAGVLTPAGEAYKAAC